MFFDEKWIFTVQFFYFSKNFKFFFYRWFDNNLKKFSENIIFSKSVLLTNKNILQFQFYKFNHFFLKFARSSKKLIFQKCLKIKCYVITLVFILWSWLRKQNCSPIQILFINTKVFLLALLVLDLQTFHKKTKKFI